MVISCKRCNERKHTKSAREYLKIINQQKLIKSEKKRNQKRTDLGKRMVYIYQLKDRLETKDLKLCTKCENLKPRSPEFFYRRKVLSDGLSSACKKCRNKITNSYRRKIRQKN